MKQPYDNKGHKVPFDCPNPNCSGRLQPETTSAECKTIWRCDGLVDPNDPRKELEACEFTHTDGDLYTRSNEEYLAWLVSTGKLPQPFVGVVDVGTSSDGMTHA